MDEYYAADVMRERQLKHDADAKAYGMHPMPTSDPELHALETILNTFGPLTDQQRKRVMAWLSDRYAAEGP